MLYGEGGLTGINQSGSYQPVRTFEAIRSDRTRWDPVAFAVGRTLHTDSRYNYYSLIHRRSLPITNKTFHFISPQYIFGLFGAD